MTLSEALRRLQEHVKKTCSAPDPDLEMAAALVFGLVYGELLLLQREAKEAKEDPFFPRHHIFEYTRPEGPNGERFTFARRDDRVSVHPLGSRGWYHTRRECVDALWEDHDRLVAQSSSPSELAEKTTEKTVEPSDAQKLSP